MPSTYTLNNGIELIGTGEQSGTWGDTTNTNLELLDVALDGQVTITAASAGSSGSPNSLPITDGSASDGRNRFVNITSGSDLGSTVYYQLTPNDAEKIIYIRNSLNTQDLIVFQGTYNSSNDYVIKNGKSAVIYFNGAGAGAVAANVLSDLQVDALAVDTDTLYVDATNDRVGINVDSPTVALDVSSGAIHSQFRVHRDVAGDNTTMGTILFAGDDSDGNVTDYSRIVGLAESDNSGGEDGQLIFSVLRNASMTEAMRIDSNQRILIGDDANMGNGSKLQIIGSNLAGSSMSLARYNAGTGANHYFGYKSRSSTVGTAGTVVADDDIVVVFRGYGDDGTDLASAVADIAFTVDGTPGSNDMPGRIVFSTTADGASASTERMRINASGHVTIGSGGSQTNNLTVYDSAADSAITIQSADASTAGLVFGDATDFSRGRIVYDNDDESMAFETNNLSEAMRIDSSQRVLIGNTSNDEFNGKFHVFSTSSTLGSVGRYANNANGPSFYFTKSRGALGVRSQVSSDDDLGIIQFSGADGSGTSTYVTGSQIRGAVDGTTGALDMPGRLEFWTTPDGASSPVERMRISEDGKVSIGTAGTSSQAKVQINGGADGSGILTARTDGGNGNNERFIITGFADGGGANYGGGIGFETRDTVNVFHEAMRIDSSQRVLIGDDSSVAVNSFENKLQITHSGYATASLAVYRNGSDGAGLNFAHSRSGTVGTNTILQDGDAFGHIYFLGADGTDFASRGAAIISRVDGTPGSNDMPGRLEFYTTADGASDVTERMRIENDGKAIFYHDNVTQLDGTANTTRGFSIRNVGSSAYGYFQTDGDMRLIQEDAGKKMTFYTANTARLNINNVGGVAIGTGGGNSINSGFFETVKPFCVNTLDSNSYPNTKQCFNGQITAGASGAWKDIARVDATNALNIYILAVDGGASVGSAVLRADLVTPYGGGLIGNKHSNRTGTISAIDVRYLNSAGTSGTIYVLQVQLSYSGSSPTVRYTVEGMSTGQIYDPN